MYLLMGFHPFVPRLLNSVELFFFIFERFLQAAINAHLELEIVEQTVSFLLNIEPVFLLLMIFLGNAHELRINPVQVSGFVVGNPHAI